MTSEGDMFSNFDRNPAADVTAIESFAATFGFEPPPGYLDFMTRSNGGEGFIGKRYLMLWPIEELRTHNEGYEVARFAPGLFLFGSSGGGEGYAFDLRASTATPTIVAVPFVGMSLEDAHPYGRSFPEFIERLSTNVDE